tara:strand:+ start:71 stop:262 length:192 start_codon:yes stop_codon:yes gene_type:complete
MVASVSKALRGFKDIIDMLQEMVDTLTIENKQLKKENIIMKERINKIMICAQMKNNDLCSNEI